MMKVTIPNMSLAALLSMTESHLKARCLSFRCFDNMVVGAIIFKFFAAGNHKLLLLKRAAHDPAFPNMFAIPGGHVEDSDKDILHALKREVLEETALVVRAVKDQTEPLAWTTERPTSGNGDSAETGPRSVQLTFVCAIEGDVFRVDPMEHSLGVWADEAEAEKLEMSVGMREVVKNAFEWKKAMMRENLKV